MNPTNDQTRLTTHYQQKHVAESYIDERFSRPLGKVQHQCQVNYVNAVIKRYAINRILEIACGPARLTAEITGFQDGVALDRSEAMLEKARARTPVEAHWQFVTGNALELDFERSFDMVYSFRFIRHLHSQERKQVYQGVRNILSAQGIFLFDAIRHDKPQFLKNYEAGGDIIVYDKVYRNKNELHNELDDAGFKVIELYSCVEHFYLGALISRLSHLLRFDSLGVGLIRLLDKIKTGTSLEWIVLCQKK